MPLTQRDAGYQAFLMLRIAFAVAPIAFGLDKFFNVLTDWPQYLAGWVDDLMPGSAQDFMYAVGAIEIVAGVLVAVRPRYGAPVVVAVARRDHLHPASPARATTTSPCATSACCSAR